MGEVQRLTWHDVNFDARCVTLYTRKKKGGHLTPRSVPMTGKFLRCWPGGLKTGMQKNPGSFGTATCKTEVVNFMIIFTAYAQPFSTICRIRK